MAKCLVLGGNGFIGSHVVDALIAGGHSVRAFDRFNGSKVFEAENVEIVGGDFLNRNDLAKALEGMEYVFHFISTTTPMSAENDPLIDIETNVRMSVELFQECVSAGVKRVIFASTGGAIYGLSRDEALRESERPLPVSPYAIGKLTIEQYLRYFSVKHKLDSITFRISNPYGERQPLRRKQGVIPIFMEKIHNEEPITILGDGSMVRDYIYVKDVANMIAEVFERDHQHAVYNMGSGVGVAVDELVKAIESTTGREAAKEHLPKPDTFVQKVVLDTSLFEAEYGLKPQTPLADGLAATWQDIIEANRQES